MNRRISQSTLAISKSKSVVAQSYTTNRLLFFSVAIIAGNKYLQITHEEPQRPMKTTQEAIASLANDEEISMLATKEESDNTIFKECQNAAGKVLSQKH